MLRCWPTQLLAIIVLFMGSRSQTPVAIHKEGNCTCVTRQGVEYSLMPLRRTDGSPRFNVRGVKYPSWHYTYNPCTPVTLPKESPTTTCHDAALCKFDPITNLYQGIGIQQGVQCTIAENGMIELVYQIVDPLVVAKHSRVLLVCEKHRKTIEQAKFEPRDENDFIFAVRHLCACPNGCPMGPTVTPATLITTILSTTPPSVVPPTAAPQKGEKPGDEAWKVLAICSIILIFVVIVGLAYRYRRGLFIACLGRNNERRPLRGPDGGAGAGAAGAAAGGGRDGAVYGGVGNAGNGGGGGNVVRHPVQESGDDEPGRECDV